MGVFARLLRRSKTTEEAATAEAGTDASTAEAAAQEPAEVKGSSENEVEADARTEDAVEETATPSTEDSAGDGVEIPKQQSAEEVADSGAGESART
ncbi:hypothetical protein ACFYRY_26255 [Streptomyces sp. NPDC005263]|uniref:hypothetical protein n=1 Tax=Streptomyces sp. NPDC005263 TaxID=3364711 RepID=UPI0036908895